MENVGTGSKAASSDTLRLLLAVKESAMKATHVAEVCQVIQVNEDTYVCRELNSFNEVLCIALNDLQINENDVVLVLFTDTDYRSNLNRLKANKQLQKIDDRILHTRDSGIIIGIVYKESNNDNA